MKTKIKKMALALAALTIVAAGIGWLPAKVSAVYNQYQSTRWNDITVLNVLIRDVGLYDSNGLLRFTVNGTNTKVSMGPTTTVTSTATTTGNSAGDLFYAYLGGATAAVEGSVLVATTPVAGQGAAVIVAPATAGLSSAVGVAASAVSTGSIVGIYSYGWALMLTTGTVNPGDYLGTSSLAAGYAASGVTVSTGVIGVAFASGNSAGGLTKVRLK